MPCPAALMSAFLGEAFPIFKRAALTFLDLLRALHMEFPQRPYVSLDQFALTFLDFAAIDNADTTAVRAEHRRSIISMTFRA